MIPAAANQEVIEVWQAMVVPKGNVLPIGQQANFQDQNK